MRSDVYAIYMNGDKLYKKMKNKLRKKCVEKYL